MATVPAGVHGPSDAELIESVRDGRVEAYGSLYERHVAAAYNLARQLTRSAAEADDLVSEAFAKVLDTLRAGRGPDSAFRAYLLTALRHTAYDKTRRDRKVELSDDVAAVAGVSPAAVSVPFADPAVAGLERSLAARAFAQLPERWQAVLWHTEIEGQSPAAVAPILGLTPNGVSALAYRAREGLRQAYLQVHLSETTEQRCRTAADKLGAWTRNGLSKREKAQVEAHLDECDRCRALAAELADVNGAMRGFVAPLVLGVGATGYLAANGTAGGVAVVVVTGAGEAGAAGAAAGAAASGPRQFLGVAASATALAAAVAIGLGSGGTQEIPAAQQQPAVSQAPSPKPVPPGKPVPPAPQPPSPAQPPPTQPPPKPVPPTSPGPTLTVQGPTQTITLTPGAGPTDVPITVHNTGGSQSQPVSATLTLPSGVHAVPAGQRMTAAPLLRLGPVRNRAVGAVTNCPGGDGTVTCRSAKGVPPGGTAVLRFRLIADQDSEGGEVTGSVSAGSAVHVKITVDVKVTPPTTEDDVRVQASPEWLDLLLPGLRWDPLVDVIATNTGTSTKPIGVHLDEPGVVLARSPGMQCTKSAIGVDCTSAAVPPRHSVLLRVRMLWHRNDVRVGPGPDGHHPRPHHRVVHVTATLGTATDTATVELHWWPWPVPIPGPGPGPAPTPSPPDSTHPSTRPLPTTTPPVTTTPTPSGPSRPPAPSLPGLPGMPASPPPGVTRPTVTPGHGTGVATATAPQGSSGSGSSGSGSSGSGSSGSGLICVRPGAYSPQFLANLITACG